MFFFQFISFEEACYPFHVSRFVGSVVCKSSNVGCWLIHSVHVLHPLEDLFISESLLCCFPYTPSLLLKIWYPRLCLLQHVSSMICHSPGQSWEAKPWYPNQKDGGGEEIDNTKPTRCRHLPTLFNSHSPIFHLIAHQHLWSSK